LYTFCNYPVCAYIGIAKGVVCTYEILHKSRALYDIFNQVRFSPTHIQATFAVLVLTPIRELTDAYELYAEREGSRDPIDYYGWYSIKQRQVSATKSAFIQKRRSIILTENGTFLLLFTSNLL
jgi:hypothetical protein